ncbi:MAG TPA: DUF1707 domain-containing protein [Jiangellaceae bacterium]|nr:DUF1707 domain-containing protein [Jiangellaceae bacterium]
MSEMDKRPEQRASDADRDIVATDLGTAFSEGRLDSSEYQRRLDTLWSSYTHAELARLTADLPEPEIRAKREKAELRKQQNKAEWLGEWKTWLGVAVILNAIWLISSLTGDGWNNYWPGWPLGIWAAILLGYGIFGSDDTEDADDDRPEP